MAIKRIKESYMGKYTKGRRAGRQAGSNEYLIGYVSRWRLLAYLNLEYLQKKRQNKKRTQTKKKCSFPARIRNIVSGHDY